MTVENEKTYKRFFSIPLGTGIKPGSNAFDSSSHSIFGQLENRRRLIIELEKAKASKDIVAIKMIEAELGYTESNRPKDDDAKKNITDMLNSVKQRLLDPNLSPQEAFSMYSKLATLDKILSGEKVDFSAVAAVNMQQPAQQQNQNSLTSQMKDVFDLTDRIEKRMEEKMQKFAPEDPLEKMKRDAEFFKMMGWASPEDARKLQTSNIEEKRIDNEFELAKLKLSADGKKYDTLKDTISDVISGIADASTDDKFVEKKDEKIMRSNRPAFNCLNEKCGKRVEFSHAEISREITCSHCNTKHNYDSTKKSDQITLA